MKEAEGLKRRRGRWTLPEMQARLKDLAEEARAQKEKTFDEALKIFS
jgi:hypothetical protein